MAIKLDFEKPEAISSSDSNKDILLIEFVDTSLIYDFVG